MATRFYLPSTGTAGASPTVCADWDYSVSAFIRRATVTTKISSAFSTISLDGNSDSNDTDYCYVQWVSAPIAAQTISAQTVDWVVSLFEENARANQYLAICIRVVSGDGNTVRGTVVALTRDNTELATSQSSRYHSATSSSVSASAGDRIVIEIGTGGNPEVGAGGDSHDADVRIGDNSATDFGESGSETSDYCGWVEFANTITFGAAAYTLTCDYASLTLTGQTVTLARALKLSADYASFALSGQAAGLLYGRKLVTSYGFFAVAGQSVTFTYTPVSGDYTLTCDYASLTLSGQTVTLTRALKLAVDYASFALAGQATTLARALKLALDYASFTLTGQDVTLTKAGAILSCDYASFTLTCGSVTLSVALWEPSTDMITFGTLLTRIQNALGDTAGATWDRTTVIWPFAVDAIRNFPILRPKTVVQTVETAGHSFTLPSDFRKVIYVEYPLYQDPPEYLARKPHLDATFYGEDGFYDVDRDFDTGEDYIMWISDDLAVDDVVSVRYLATHTTDFANEYAYITIENQYVQVIVNHVVLMCYQERLGTQLQDPTAHTSTIQQMAEAVKSAQTVYLASLTRAEEELSSSQRISGWKVDKHDRIY
jgi:hypothetical protein